MARLTDKEAEWHFRHLVLSGIWMLARLIVNPRWAGSNSADWRAEALAYCDDQGNQSEGAREYRRTRTYPVIRDGDHRG